jgi:hypothetical protein
MKNDNEMDRLRAARPAAPPPANDHDARFAQTVAEPGDPRLASHTTIGKAHSARRWTPRPRIVAGGSLGLAGVAAGLVLGFSGSTAPPAFAISRNGDGSLLVHLYHVSAVPAAEQQINAMDSFRDVHESIAPAARATRIQGTLDIAIQRGPATVPGPIKCSTGDLGQQVEMLLGSNGTDVVPAGVRGAGSWHLAFCSITPPRPLSNTGTTTGSTTGTTTGSTGSNTGNTGDTGTSG